MIPTMDNGASASPPDDARDEYSRASSSSTSPTTTIYDTAVSALLSPLHQSVTPEAIRAASARRRSTVKDVRTYLRRIDLPHDSPLFPDLIFHVAGTKGKGSTCAFVESILRRTKGLRTGTFTSPHLVEPRERIRVDGAPVSEEAFGGVYWEVRRRLETWAATAAEEEGRGRRHDGGNDDGLPILPGYFRMLALMAYFTFARHRRPRLDVMILEVGMGGRYDATNVFDGDGRTIIRGVTLIDYDHVRVLGSTLGQIAWEKGGIFESDKATVGPSDGGYAAFSGGDGLSVAAPSSPLLSSNEAALVFAAGTNPPEVRDVLRRCAAENSSELRFVEETDINTDGTAPALGLRGRHQSINAALASAMCREGARWRTTTGESPNGGGGAATDDGRVDLKAALAEASWPGRCHTLPLLPILREDGGAIAQVNLRCDGAHTPKSMAACLEWFRDVTSSPAPASPSSPGDAPPPTTTDESALVRRNAAQGTKRVLIFNCGHERNPVELLDLLVDSRLFDAAYFCVADSERPSAVQKASSRELLHDAGIVDPTEEKDGAVCVKIEGAGMSIDRRKTNDDDAGGDGNGGRDGGRSSSTAPPPSTSWQETLAEVWTALERRRCRNGDDDGSAIPVSCGASVGDAIADVRERAAEAMPGDRVEICVTGSLYIVGSALRAVGWEAGGSTGDVDWIDAPFQ